MKYNGITVRFTPRSVLLRLMTVLCLPFGLIIWIVAIRDDQRDGIVVSWWRALCETYGYLFDIVVAGSCGD